MVTAKMLLGGMDTAKLEEDLRFLTSGEWTNHVNNACYEGEWDIFPLRCQSHHLCSHPILQCFDIEQGVEWQNLPILHKCPAIFSVLNQLKCNIKSARLMRLKSGAYIKPHRDSGLAAHFGEARLHLPLQTSSQVDFVVDGNRINMMPGQLWYIDADKTHWVRNNSTEDRIHLVIDCDANEWLMQLIES